MKVNKGSEVHGEGADTCGRWGVTRSAKNGARAAASGVRRGLARPGSARVRLDCACRRIRVRGAFVCACVYTCGVGLGARYADVRRPETIRDPLLASHAAEILCRLFLFVFNYSARGTRARQSGRATVTKVVTDGAVGCGCCKRTEYA